MHEGLSQERGSGRSHSAVQVEGDKRVVQRLLDALEDEMNEMPVYTEYHPKWHRARVSTYWWTRQWKYLKFILRELSSLSVAYFVVLTLLQLRALIGGPASYEAFQE